MGRKPAQKQASALRALVTITLDTTKLRAPGTVRKHYGTQRYFAKYRPRRILGQETWPDNVGSLRPYVHTQTAALSEVSTAGLRLLDQEHRKCQKHFDRLHLMCGSRKPRYFTAVPQGLGGDTGSKWPQAPRLRDRCFGTSVPRSRKPRRPASPDKYDILITAPAVGLRF